MVSSLPSPGPSAVGYKTTEVPTQDMQLNSTDSLMQYHKEVLLDMRNLSPREHQQLLNSQQQMLMAASSGSFRGMGMGSGQLTNTSNLNENNRLNMRARKERNMKFITYLRAQMMQEYGFDFEDIDKTQQM